MKESDTRVRNAVTFPFLTFISASRQGPPHRIFPAIVGPLGLSDLHHDRNENDQHDDYDGPKDYANPLVASNLGWTFDGFEVFALILTVGVALHQLLDPSQHQFIPAYAGAIIAITVFGWGLGGLLGGVLADYLGRKRSMTLTILAYSLLTGLSAFFSVRARKPDRARLREILRCVPIGDRTG